MSLFLCQIPGVAAFFAVCALPPPIATGYVEGDYTLVTPVSVAQIANVTVARGDSVEAGEVLVRMERRDAEIAVAGAEAGLAEARSRLADLMEGRRLEEIRVIEASLASARAESAAAERTMSRISNLAERGAATEAQREDTTTQFEVARARVAETEAELAVARMPARAHEIAAAEASVNGAAALLEKATWDLDQRMLTAPVTGMIFDVIRTAGEIAGPSAPILSILAEDAVKLRLYVPETSFSLVDLGTELKVNCDACPEDTTAMVTYVSDQPEFTPPVIYSIENRQKLVYLVEAVPLIGGALKPGQIVDVTLPGGRP